MPKPATTRSKYYLLIDHYAITVADKPAKVLIRMPISFVLEDQIYNIYNLQRLGIFNLASNGGPAGTITPIHFSLCKDVMKAGFLQEWRLTCQIKQGEAPNPGFASTITTTIVSPPQLGQEKVESFFIQDFSPTIGGKPYFYVPGSLKKVRGRAFG